MALLVLDEDKRRRAEDPEVLKMSGTAGCQWEGTSSLYTCTKTDVCGGTELFAQADTASAENSSPLWANRSTTDVHEQKGKHGLTQLILVGQAAKTAQHMAGAKR